MTDAIIIIVGLSVFGFSVAWFADRAEGMTHSVTCRCGRHLAHRIIVVDEVDRRRAIESLSEGCPHCMAKRDGVESAKDVLRSSGTVKPSHKEVTCVR